MLGESCGRSLTAPPQGTVGDRPEREFVCSHYALTTGRYTLNVVPSPTTLSTVILPPN